MPESPLQRGRSQERTVGPSIPKRGEKGCWIGVEKRAQGKGSPYLCTFYGSDGSFSHLGLQIKLCRDLSPGPGSGSGRLRQSGFGGRGRRGRHQHVLGDATSRCRMQNRSAACFESKPQRLCGGNGVLCPTETQRNCCYGRRGSGFGRQRKNEPTGFFGRLDQTSARGGTLLRNRRRGSIHQRLQRGGSHPCVFEGPRRMRLQMHLLHHSLGAGHQPVRPGGSGGSRCAIHCGPRNSGGRTDRGEHRRLRKGRIWQQTPRAHFFGPAARLGRCGGIGPDPHFFH